MTFLKKFEPEKESKLLVWKTRRILLFAGIFLSGLLVIEIWIGHSLINSGEKLQRIDDIKESLTLENQILENEIATRSALINIATRSAELGFSSVKDIQYIR